MNKTQVSLLLLTIFFAMNLVSSDAVDIAKLDLESSHPQFEKLLQCSPSSVKAFLDKHPKFLAKADMLDQTILHHLAYLAKSNQPAEHVKQMIDTVLSYEGMDFSAVDFDDNTPLHIAAMKANTRVGCEIVFPAFVKKVQTSKFDFSKVNGAGKTVLQLAVMNPREILPIDYYRSNALTLLDSGVDVAMDALSKSGGTALFYAINYSHDLEASYLLERGAQVDVFTNLDRDPCKEIENTIANLTKKIIELEKYYGEGLDSPIRKIYTTKLENFLEIKRLIHHKLMPSN